MVYALSSHSHVRLALGQVDLSLLQFLGLQSAVVGGGCSGCCGLTLGCRNVGLDPFQLGHLRGQDLLVAPPCGVGLGALELDLHLAARPDSLDLCALARRLVRKALSFHLQAGPVGGDLLRLAISLVLDPSSLLAKPSLLLLHRRLLFVQGGRAALEIVSEAVKLRPINGAGAGQARRRGQGSRGHRARGGLARARNLGLGLGGYGRSKRFTRIVSRSLLLRALRDSFALRVAALCSLFLRRVLVAGGAPGAMAATGCRLCCWLAGGIVLLRACLDACHLQTLHSRRRVRRRRGQDSGG